jgi:hypothetical protein
MGINIIIKFRKFNIYSVKYSNTIDAAVIIINAINPAILMMVVLVNSPIILLLFEMCSMIAIKTGAVQPYKIAV